MGNYSNDRYGYNDRGYDDPERTVSGAGPNGGNGGGGGKRPGSGNRGTVIAVIILAAMLIIGAGVVIWLMSDTGRPDSTPTPTATSSPAPTQTPTPAQTQAPTPAPTQPPATEPPAVNADTSLIISSNDIVYVIGYATKVYSERDEGSTVVSWARAGTQLTRTGYDLDGWSQVELYGSLRYIPTARVSTLLVWTPCDDTVTTTEDNCSIRSGPSVDDKEIAQVDAGVTFRRTAYTNTCWCEIVYEGKNAYISCSLVGDYGEPEVIACQDEVTTWTGGAELHLEANVESTQTATLPINTTLRRIGYTATGWSLVEYNGRTVYILTELTDAG